MVQRKHIMAAFILMTASLTAFFILFGDSSEKQNQISGDPVLPSKESWMDVISEKISSEVESDLKNKDQESAKDVEKINLTTALAQSFTNQMITKTDGNIDTMQKVDFEDAQLRGILENSLNDMPPDIFNSPVNDSDIKIGRDNSRDAKYRYMEQVGQIVFSRFGSDDYIRSDKQIVDDLNADCFTGGASMSSKLATLYKNLTEDYLKLEVPSDWAALHKTAIGYFKKSNLVHSALASCKEDVVKGYTAAQTIPALIAEEKALQEMMIQKSKELK